MQVNCERQKAPTNAFSEWQPGTGQNAYFSWEICTFRLPIVQTARRSLVENDHPPLAKLSRRERVGKNRWMTTTLSLPMMKEGFSQPLQNTLSAWATKLLATYSRTARSKNRSSGSQAPMGSRSCGSNSLHHKPIRTSFKKRSASLSKNTITNTQVAMVVENAMVRMAISLIILRAENTIGVVRS